MKNNQILILVGVIALVLIIANWNKIFGKTDKKRMGGRVAPGGPGTQKQTICGKSCTKTVDHYVDGIKVGTKTCTGKYHCTGGGSSYNVECICGGSASS